MRAALGRSTEEPPRAAGGRWSVPCQERDVAGPGCAAEAPGWSL